MHESHGDICKGTKDNHTRKKCSPKGQGGPKRKASKINTNQVMLKEVKPEEPPAWLKMALEQMSLMTKRMEDKSQEPPWEACRSWGRPQEGKLRSRQEVCCFKCGENIYYQRECPQVSQGKGQGKWNYKAPFLETIISSTT